MFLTFSNRSVSHRACTEVTAWKACLILQHCGPWSRLVDHSHITGSCIRYHLHVFFYSQFALIHYKLLYVNVQVTDLLKEQLYLQSELRYEAVTPSSGRSSRASSPGRLNRKLESRSSSPQRGSVYRATLNLTPTVPPRPGMEVARPVSPERMEESTTSLELSRDEDEMSLDGRRSRATECCSPTEWRSRSGGNGDLQHLIQEVRELIQWPWWED